MKAAAVVAAAVAAAMLCLPLASAHWIIPASIGVGFEYTGGAGINVSFNANSTQSDYSALSAPDIVLPSSEEGFLADYGFNKYNDSLSHPLYFGGWYTAPQGGSLIKTYGQAVAASEDGSLSLYARWESKAILTVSLQDLNYNLYNISFELICGESAVSLQTYATQTIENIYYVNPVLSWRLSASARSSKVELGSDNCALTAGQGYLFTAKILSSGIAKIDSALTPQQTAF